MKAEHNVVETLGLFRIHTHYYASPAPRGTVILVNGSLATTASFAQTVRYLQPHFNVVLFDEPYAGQSKPLNSNRRPITKEQEAGILLELIEHYQADHLMSFSWGGASALLALAQRPVRHPVPARSPRARAPWPSHPTVCLSATVRSRPCAGSS